MLPQCQLLLCRLVLGPEPRHAEVFVDDVRGAVEPVAVGVQVATLRHVVHLRRPRALLGTGQLHLAAETRPVLSKCPTFTNPPPGRMVASNTGRLRIEDTMRIEVGLQLKGSCLLFGLC